MRINAHIASAFLPTDKSVKKPIPINMKKRELNLELVAEQKREIRDICTHYSVTTTKVAQRAELVPSTINRFMKDNPPSNALSAITMQRIRKVWPLKAMAPESDSLAGILSAIQVIFAILTARRQIRDKDLEDILNHQLVFFRRQNQQGAIEVLQQLIESLGLKPHESKIQAIRKLLLPVQAG